VVIGTLAFDGCTVTFGTARRGAWAAVAPLGHLLVVPNVTVHPSTPVYELHIIRCGIIIPVAL